METIEINYLNEIFKVQLTRIKAFPYDVFKIEFKDSPQLTTIIGSPVYVIEIPDKLTFSEFQNTEGYDLLMSFAEGIEEDIQSFYSN